MVATIRLELLIGAKGIFLVLECTQVDISVAKAEVEAAAQADREARAGAQERRKTEHDARV